MASRLNVLSARLNVVFPRLSKSGFLSLEILDFEDKKPSDINELSTI